MNQSASTSRLVSAAPAAARWAPEFPAAFRVRPANRTELRGALEANEVFLSLLENLPDASHCETRE